MKLEDMTDEQIKILIQQLWEQLEKVLQESRRRRSKNLK